MAVGGLSPTLLGGVQMIFAVVTCYGMQFMCGTKIDTLWDKDKLKACVPRHAASPRPRRKIRALLSSHRSRAVHSRGPPGGNENCDARA
jgi:hypothetical protein